MSMILNIASNNDMVNIDINEEALISLDSDDFQLQSFNGLKRQINFYLDRKLNYEESCDILRKLETISGSNGKIRIFTSGCNFNEMMKAIGNFDSKRYEIHIDDIKNVRNIIDSSNVISGLNFSRICCDCYFSERYLLNFNASEFDALCNISKCKFDRNRLKQIRMDIEKVWNKLIPLHININSLDQFSKVELVLEYISSNKELTNHLKLLGNCSKEEAKVLIFNMLLDNYVTRVNSKVVHGRNLLNNCDAVWVVTSIAGNNYGHCLVNNERFSDLEEKGYVDGVIRLDEEHKYRNDFTSEVGQYECLDCDDYSNIKRILEYKKRGYNSGFSDFDVASGMPPLFPEGSNKPVISYVEWDLPKKMPLLFTKETNNR